MFNLRKPTVLRSLILKTVFFFKIRLEFKFQEHSYREVSIQEQNRILISRISWKFFFSRTVWKFLFQEQTRILFHEQSFNMFKNRQDLFQEKSRRFHFKNNWKFNFMKKLEFSF